MSRVRGFLVRRLFRENRVRQRLRSFYGFTGMSSGLNTLRMANNSGNYEHRPRTAGRLGMAMYIPGRDRRPVDPPAMLDGEDWPDLYRLAVRRRF